MDNNRPPSMAQEHERAVTISQLAHLLAVSEQKVYRMAQGGEIPAFKVGREWRFFPSKVIAKLEEPQRPWAQSNRSLARKRAR